MSHFTVMVRVTREQIEKHGSAESALKALLAPYQENNMGDCPKEFLSFHDETETVEEDWEELSKEERAKYTSKAAFAKDYHGYGEHDGKFGYFENPNKKWDWWTLGGRWSGFFPLKPGRAVKVGAPGAFDNQPEEGHGDMVAFDDIDLDLVATRERENAEKFWNEWQRFIAGEKFRAFEGPRSRALDVGLLVVRQGPPLPGEENRAIPWAKSVQPGDSRAGWHDVYAEVTRDELLTRYAAAFNPIQPYAFLDECGWRQPGKMGWFACTDATPDTRQAHWAQFAEWFKATPRDAVLAIVDCHI